MNQQLGEDQRARRSDTVLVLSEAVLAIVIECSWGHRAGIRVLIKMKRQQGQHHQDLVSPSLPRRIVCNRHGHTGSSAAISITSTSTVASD
ncbi:hypothetical protein [Roseimaritima sediminicola]|uniref:hypothetical protein n=1 Tax=Roseimaritima sediminicola TaxID=2662066 RepID=UPI001298378B|nr:hypothetical protein [Roseimaritima sediminicola]